MNANLPPGHFFFTSESVTCGHPDKLSDYISDSILDACLEQDPDSIAGCEAGVKNNTIFIFGEVNCKVELSLEAIARKAVEEVGYNSVEVGMDSKSATVIVIVDRQSPEISKSVHENKLEH